MSKYAVSKGMALSVLTTRVLTLREVLGVRVCVGLRRRLRVVVVHAPCVPTTTTYSLRIYRCPYYLFTDARTTTTTYLPMHVLHTYRFTYYYYVPMYLLLLTELGACPRRSPSDSSSRRGPLRACPGLEVGVRGWGLGVGD